MTTTHCSLASIDRAFDTNGRRIAKNLSTAAHVTVRRRFICEQPIIDYAAIHDRITRHLDCAGAISSSAFEERAKSILDKLRGDEVVSEVENAVAVPFFLPRTPGISSGDLGKEFEERYLRAVGRSFHEMFPVRAFITHHKAGLSQRLRVAAGSRHEQVLWAMDEDAVVGYVFVSLTEFSIPAALEQMSTLPHAFSLSGGFDLGSALIGSPNLLLRSNGYPPLIWLAGLQAESETAGYHFEAYGYDLTFNRRVHFGMAAEYWASTLTVLG